MEAHISHSYTSYVLDPQVYGLDSSVWKTVSGTPAVASSKYRLNAAEMITYAQYRFGEVEFNVTVPVAPAASDNRRFGFSGKGLGNRGIIAFEFVTAGEFRARVRDKYGNSLFNEIIPWQAAWTNVATLFRIGWTRNAVTFTVSLTDGTSIWTTTYLATVNPLSLPMNIDALNANADNMDIASVLVMHSNASLPVNPGSGSITAIVPGTGATNLGKAEDAAHASGDVGVEVLAVRRDTAASSTATEGDYATVNTDSLGHLWTREGYAATAEDNTNGVFAGATKPLATSTYSWSRFVDFGASATLNVKASAGNVLSAYCINTNAAIRYLQLHNTATTPAGGAVPLFSFAIPASGASVLIGSDFFGANGFNFTTGIAFAYSTTAGTYTAGTAGEQFTQVMYK